jgi:hypothetical protein
MKNKFLVIAAATTTALGTALVWTPAHAQVNGSNVPVPLNITVPEVLFLKTVNTINLTISATDIAASLTPNGTGFYGSSQSGTASTNGSTLDTTSPFAGTATNKITQTIPNVYVVWSNSPRAGGVNITFNKTGSNPNTKLTLAGGIDTATYSVVSGNLTGLVPQGLVTPTQTGGVTLDIDLTNAKTAGLYQGGTLFVTADAP